jgi:hypothetical protein
MSSTTKTTGLFFGAGRAARLAEGLPPTTGTAGTGGAGIVTTTEQDGHFARVPASRSGTCDVWRQFGQVNGKGMGALSSRSGVREVL